VRRPAALTAVLVAVLAVELVLGAVTRPWEALTGRAPAPTQTPVLATPAPPPPTPRASPVVPRPKAIPELAAPARTPLPGDGQPDPCVVLDEAGNVRVINIPCGPNLPPGAR
jgi:hypothetical protein